MGFFFEQVAAPPKASSKRGGAAAARAKLASTAKGCDACPLQGVWPRIASAKMPMRGNTRDGDILVLGEGPGMEDDREGGAFLGNYWKLHRKLLPGRFNDRLVFQNLTRCCPVSEVRVTPQEVHACSDHLAADVDSLPKLRAVLGVGQAVLTRFFPGASLSQAHGMWMPIQLGRHQTWFFCVFDLSYLQPRGGGRPGFRDGPEDSAAYPVLQADLRIFFDEVHRKGRAEVVKELVPGNVLLPRSEGEAREMLDAFEFEPPRTVDLETSGLRPYNTGAKIYTGSISDGYNTISFPVQHPDAPNEWGLRLLLETVHEHRWVAHNAGFEYMWLAFFARQLGLPWCPQPFDDTMGMARLLNKRATMSGLAAVSKLVLGVDVKSLLHIDTTRLLEYPLEEVLRYGGLDTLSTGIIARKLRKRIERDQENYQRILLATRATSEMALAGLDPDFEVAEKLKAEWQAKAADAEAKARTIYEVKAFERERGVRLSLASADDVGEALVVYGRLKLPKTPAGKQYKTDDAALQEAVGDTPHPLVDAVLAYREASKMVSTYIDVTLDSKTRCYDGRLHPSYNTMLTHTLRLSSEDPNIQNWPARKHRDLRKQVKAGKKRKMVKFDYKALEARVIAMASRDRNLCESTIKKVDIHSKWRDRTLHIHPPYLDSLVERLGTEDEKKLMKGARDIIKTDFVFAGFYGASLASRAQRTGMPMNRMEELDHEFWSTYPGVRQWIKGQRRTYREKGSVFTLTGRERHGILGGNEPINNYAQASGADIVADAMNDLSTMAIEEQDFFLHPRIQIHDDLTFILPDDERMDGYIERIVECLTRLRYSWQIVPLAVEGSIGDNWADMYEFCNVEGPYHR